MRFHVRYDDPDELLADAAQQLDKGGFLVRVAPPEGLALFAPAVLVLELAGRQVALSGQVVQSVPGAGVAVAVQPDASLASLLEAARARTGCGGAPAVHSLDEAEKRAAPQDGPRSRPAKEAHARVRDAGRAEKIRLARYGTKDERLLIMRGNDPALQRLVLKNPGLGLEEVRVIAGLASIPPDVLKAVAEHREWSSRPEIALALVRNPKTPVPIAQKLVPHLSMSDLRQLAKTSSLRMPVLQAVRKRVVGP